MNSTITVSVSNMERLEAAIATVEKRFSDYLEAVRELGKIEFEIKAE